MGYRRRPSNQVRKVQKEPLHTGRTAPVCLAGVATTAGAAPSSEVAANQFTRIFLSVICDFSVESNFIRQRASGMRSRDPYHRGDASELLIAGNRRRLDEKLVAALGVSRRFLLHGLKKHCGIVSFGDDVPGERAYRRHRSLGPVRCGQHWDGRNIYSMSGGDSVEGGIWPYCFGAVVLT